MTESGCNILQIHSCLLLAKTTKKLQSSQFPRSSTLLLDSNSTTHAARKTAAPRSQKRNIPDIHRTARRKFCRQAISRIIDSIVNSPSTVKELNISRCFLPTNSSRNNARKNGSRPRGMLIKIPGIRRSSRGTSHFFPARSPRDVCARKYFINAARARERATLIPRNAVATLNFVADRLIGTFRENFKEKYLPPPPPPRHLPPPPLAVERPDEFDIMFRYRIICWPRH